MILTPLYSVNLGQRMSFSLYLFPRKRAAVRSADTYQKISSNCLKRSEKSKMVVNGSKSGKISLLPFFLEL